MSNRTHISSANTPEVITLFRVPALGARGAEIQVDDLPAAGAFRQLTAANFWHGKDLWRSIQKAAEAGIAAETGGWIIP